MLFVTRINPVFMLRQALPLLHLFQPPGRVVATNSTTSKHQPYFSSANSFYAWIFSSVIPIGSVIATSAFKSMLVGVLLIMAIYFPQNA